jgi:hypothetical protein
MYKHTYTHTHSTASTFVRRKIDIVSSSRLLLIPMLPPRKYKEKRKRSRASQRKQKYRTHPVGLAAGLFLSPIFYGRA